MQKELTNKIKTDLKQLKKNIKYIESYKEAEKSHKSRVTFLERLGKAEYAKEIEREKALLKRLNPTKYIIEAGLLEERYMEAIDKLSPVDKTIIIETYLNGKPYWKTGEALGYTEEGIRKRISKSILQIAKFKEGK